MLSSICIKGKLCQSVNLKRHLLKLLNQKCNALKVLTLSCTVVVEAVKLKFPYFCFIMTFGVKELLIAYRRTPDCVPLHLFVMVHCVVL